MMTELLNKLIVTICTTAKSNWSNMVRSWVRLYYTVCIYRIIIELTIKTKNCSIDTLYIRLSMCQSKSNQNYWFFTGDNLSVFANFIRFLGAIIATPSLHTPTSIVRLTPSTVFTLVISGTASVLLVIKPTTSVITMWTTIRVLPKAFQGLADCPEERFLLPCRVSLIPCMDQVGL